MDDSYYCLMGRLSPKIEDWFFVRRLTTPEADFMIEHLKGRENRRPPHVAQFYRVVLLERSEYKTVLRDKMHGLVIWISESQPDIMDAPPLPRTQRLIEKFNSAAAEYAEMSNEAVITFEEFIKKARAIKLE